MAKENSLVEDAFIQMKNLEEAVAENAKGILASTMKAEIKELVKESLFEQEDEIDDTEVDMDAEDDVDVTDLDAEMDTDNLDIDSQGEEDFDMEMDDEEPIDLTGDEVSDEEVLRVFQLMGPEDEVIVKKDNEGNINLKDNTTNKEYMIVQESDMDNEEMFEWDDLEEDDSLDMSGLEEDDDIDMSGLEEDDDIDMSGLEEDDDIDMSGLEEDDESIESIVERLFNEQNEYDDLAEDEFQDVNDFDEDEEEVENIYEIEMDGEEDEQDEEEPVMESKNSIKPKGVGMGKPKFNYDSKPNQGKGFATKRKQGPKSVGTGSAKKGFSYKDGENLDGEFKVNPKKVEAKEASRTKANGSNFRSGGLPKPRAHSSFNTAIKENQNRQELQILREKNEEYRKALNVFRNKLNEVAVFNSNLAYATRLFTEHTTTKQEKINILRRFDSVETIKESKNLFQNLKEELSGNNSKPINESIERTIDKSPVTGSAVNLIESKTYENPQFLRMKDLMGKIK
jgi:hypothetical protein